MVGVYIGRSYRDSHYSFNCVVSVGESSAYEPGTIIKIGMNKLEVVSIL